MIIDLFTEKGDYFTNKIIKQCKRDANILLSVKSDTKRTIKSFAKEGGLYSQVVMIRCSMMRIKFINEALFKDNEKKNESSINYQMKDNNKKRTVIT